MLRVLVALLLPAAVGVAVSASGALPTPSLMPRLPRGGEATEAGQTSTGFLSRGQFVLFSMRAAACQAAIAEADRGAAAGLSASLASECRYPSAQRSTAMSRSRAIPAQLADGLLVDRQRLLTLGPVALDLVIYTSSDLLVGGLLCYLDDGRARSTVIHLKGGLGGIFINPGGGEAFEACYRWAALHDHTAFVPSFRGQDGSEGAPELCLGEADDVTAAVSMLRGLAEVDPDRLALVGGSLGGCVALRAGGQTPNLRAVVAIAPPTDFAALMGLHRNAYQPTTEIRCDGSQAVWNQGGVEFAEELDTIICGNPNGCSQADYDLRSPIPFAVNSPNPTLVVVAGADNLVPTEQQITWSLVRELLAGPISVAIRDRCSQPSPPPLTRDVLLYVPEAQHIVGDGPVMSSLLYLLSLLDAPSSGGSEL